MNGGLIGIIANDAGRFSLFSSCVTKLHRPEGSTLEWLIGGDWCGARNQLVEMTLEGDHEWLWFMDDDHAFPPTLLTKLLLHDVPLVNPLCLARIAPFPLVTYSHKEGDALYLPINLDEAPEEGLIELEAGGCAGMLIRREVLEAIEPPWFEYTDRSEDIVFCEKAKAAGFKLYADLSARLGHITTAVVWPAVNEGKWQTGVTVGRDLNLFIAPAHELVGPPEEGQEEPVAGGLRSTDAAGTSSAREAERIEVWWDEGEFRWYWRAVRNDGSTYREQTSFLQESSLLEHVGQVWPGVDIYQIAREIDDSRQPQRYGPPVRLWHR